MKNDNAIVIETFIGIGYLVLFLFGFFTDNQNFFHIGGIAMLIFMFMMIKGPMNLFAFLFMCLMGCMVADFISHWWFGLFWVSAFYTVGHLL